MSYESKMLEQLQMPPRKEVEKALLSSLFKHSGFIKEFGAGEEIVEEIANCFGLNEQQKSAYLETIYRRENRKKRSFLWHRLLFRAADSLAKEKLVSKPTQTYQITGKKEWMLTERGFDESLSLLNIPRQQKNLLPIKSYEVQKIIKKLMDARRPENYVPFDNQKKAVVVKKETVIRKRGFRLAVIEAYDYKCAFCGMKIHSPDLLSWEVEAAHIVPNSSRGKDDLLNGIALCRLHHWAFDVGWFALQEDYTIVVSSKTNCLSPDFGVIGSYDFIRNPIQNTSKMLLPKNKNIFPHINSIRWHLENIFHN